MSTAERFQYYEQQAFLRRSRARAVFRSITGPQQVSDTRFKSWLQEYYRSRPENTQEVTLVARRAIVT
jgi:hypothetical protein